MFEFFMKMFGYGPVSPPKKTVFDEGPVQESYIEIPFEKAAKELPVEEFILDKYPVPQANNAIGYYDNLREKLEAEEKFHYKLLNESVWFISRLNIFNLRKSNQTTAEIDEERAKRAFGQKDYGGYAGTIDQSKLAKATARFEAGDVNLKDNSDNV